MQIANEKVVSIDYTLTDPAGKVLDTSKGSAPMPYLHGAGNIIPGLEIALTGKQTGDSLQVTIPPDQAYGLHNAEMIQEVPRKMFPSEVTIVPGMQFQAATEHGPRVVTVVATTDDTVKIDANHPLAGVTLHFDVTIKEVRNATPEEITHGHAHGPGGHHHH